MIYPGSSPEFRVLIKENNEQELQIRYVHLTYKYTGDWVAVPKVVECDVCSNSTQVGSFSTARSA